MRVIVVVCHGSGVTRRHAGRRSFLKDPSRRQMTMASARFQQTGIGDTGRQHEHPNQQHQESGVAFGKGAGKKFHGDMRKGWFIVSSNPGGLLIFVKRGRMDVDRDQGLQPASCLAMYARPLLHFPARKALHGFKLHRHYLALSQHPLLLLSP